MIQFQPNCGVLSAQSMVVELINTCYWSHKFTGHVVICTTKVDKNAVEDNFFPVRDVSVMGETSGEGDSRPF